MMTRRIIFCSFYLACVSGIFKDVVYVMDRSGSVKEADFDESVDFVYNVTEYLDIGSSDMQVSIVLFSNFRSEIFDLNDHTTKTDLLTAIKNLRGTVTTGGTYTYSVIDYVRKYSFTSAKGGRSGANRTVVILTDGLSSDVNRTVAAADNLRNESGAEVFSIGIGATVSRSNDELKGIANDPDSYYVHYIDTFVYLCNLVPALVPKLDSTVTPSLLADCPTPPSTTQVSTETVDTGTDSPTTGITTTQYTTETYTTTTATTGITIRTQQTGVTSQTTDLTTAASISSTVHTVNGANPSSMENGSSSSSMESGSSGNTAAVAAGAALGVLAAAATTIVSAALLRRWYLSEKEDPIILAAVSQYQQAPLGSSKSRFVKR